MMNKISVWGQKIWNPKNVFAKDENGSKMFVNDLAYIIDGNFKNNNNCLILVRIVSIEPKNHVCYRIVDNQISPTSTANDNFFDFTGNNINTSEIKVIGEFLHKIPENFTITKLPEEWLEEILVGKTFYSLEDFKNL